MDKAHDGEEEEDTRSTESIIDGMCAIAPSHGTVVGNVEGRPLKDARLFGPAGFGTFAIVHEFHRYMRGGLEVDSKHTPEISTLMVQ